MSNMTRGELQRIYDAYHIVFLNIQKEAAKFGVDLAVFMTEGGTISFRASDYSDKEVIRSYEIMQNEIDYSYEERTVRREN